MTLWQTRLLSVHIRHFSPKIAACAENVLVKIYYAMCQKLMAFHAGMMKKGTLS